MSEDSTFPVGPSAFERLKEHLQSGGLKFHSDEDTKTIQLFVAGECLVYNCRWQLSPDGEILQLTVFLAVSVRDSAIRPLVAEALARANQGLPLGRFDIDPDTGDISHFIGQAVRGGSLDDEWIAGIFNAGLSAADRYFPAIMRVMFAGHTPADAVFLSELDIHAAALVIEETMPAPSAAPAKPVTARRRTPQKKRRVDTTGDLPGLFDRPEAKDGPPRI